MKQNRRITPGLAAIALLAMLAVPSSQSAAADKTGASLVKGREFVKIRRELLKAGWEPVISDYTMNDGTPENQFGVTGQLYRAGFTEVEICTEGRSYCTFNYRRAGKCLQIITRETDKKNGLLNPVLQRWTDKCFE